MTRASATTSKLAAQFEKDLDDPATIVTAANMLTADSPTA